MTFSTSSETFETFKEREHLRVHSGATRKVSNAQLLAHGKQHEHPLPLIQSPPIKGQTATNQGHTNTTYTIAFVYDSWNFKTRLYSMIESIGIYIYSVGMCIYSQVIYIFKLTWDSHKFSNKTKQKTNTNKTITEYGYGMMLRIIIIIPRVIYGDFFCCSFVLFFVICLALVCVIRILYVLGLKALALRNDENNDYYWCLGSITALPINEFSGYVM